ALQLAGDGLLIALRHGEPRARELADQCVARLHQRSWDGDEELADQLLAALDRGPTPLLRPLPVDLQELASVLEGDPAEGGGWIDLRTGEVVPQSVLDDGWPKEDDPRDDPDRWFEVRTQGSRDAYHDMELFTELITDATLADRLLRALAGRGPFRAFKAALDGEPAEVERWLAFSEERTRGRARAWLTAEGYTTSPRSL
ncbi:MAG: UPF0158 family protein, partial [bacterium]|nr:UPF0158 family protein [bacterium]